MANFLKFLRATDRNPGVILFRKLFAKILHKILFFDWILSSNRSQIDPVSIEIDPTSIFVFAHYSKKNQIDDFDKNVLLEMRQLGFTVILVTNSSNDCDKLADIVLKKGKFGRDFATLRDVVRMIPTNNGGYVEILYMNSSMIWKKCSFSTLLKLLRNFPLNDVVVPTISLNPVQHAQPFFVYTRLDFPHLVLYKKSFDWIKNVRFKRSAVIFSEYRFCSSLTGYGWQVSPVANYSELLKVENQIRSELGELPLSEKNTRYNPTQHFWRCLPHFGIFAIKRTLVEKNPVYVRNPPVGVLAASKYLELLR
jgi:hypothetical protein